MLLVVSLQLHLQRALFLGDEELEPGVLPASGAHFEAAGQGMVGARTLRDLGLPVQVLSLAGGSTGELVGQELTREGLGHVLVPTLTPTPMSFRLYSRSAYELEVEEYREDPIRFGGEEMREMLARLDELLPDCRGVLLCGDSPSQGAEFLYTEMERRIVELGIPLVVKSRGQSLVESLRSGAEILVSRRKHWDRAAESARCNGEQLLEQAFEAGCTAVVLTDGACRVSLITSEGELLLEPPATRGRGGRAPGEALAAGLLHRLVQGWDLQPATCYGIAAGTAQTLKPLGGRLSPDAIEGFYRQVRAVVSESPVLPEEA